MTDTKPTWRKGDILAVPQNLAQRGSSIPNGCQVFEADSDPELRGLQWWYVLRPASELRPATIEDVERLIEITEQDLLREAFRLANLRDLRSKVRLISTTGR